MLKSLATGAVLAVTTAAITALIWTQPGGDIRPQRQEHPRPQAELNDPRLVSHYIYAGCPEQPYDADGVLLVDYSTTFAAELGRQYNPTTISQTALGCFHTYKRTGLTKYRDRFLNQIEWLRRNAIPHGENAAAYEYKFEWSHGLKPGWRSGLAQGQAISALIRYFYETKDTSVLPLIKRLKNYMLLPIEKGGVSAKSPEGLLWIEEFPTQPVSFVLNGFISSTFGLYEYVKLFPKDSLAAAQYQEAIASIKAAIPHYDAGDWTYLDRRAQPYPKANDSYARGYVWQTASLWRLTGDPFFLRTSLRWSSFFDDVHLKRMSNTLERDGVQKALPNLDANFPGKNALASAKALRSPKAIPGYGLDQLWDENFDTYFAPISNGPVTFEFKLARKTVANTLALSLYNVELYPKDLTIEVRDASWQSYRTVPYQLTTSRRNFVYHFDQPVEASSIRIRARQFAGQDRLVIGDLSLGFAPKRSVYPDHGSTTSEPMRLESGYYLVKLSVPAESQNAVFVMYRKASTADAIATASWEWEMLDPFRDDAFKSEGGFFQFRIVGTTEAAKRGWSTIGVKEAAPAD